MCYGTEINRALRSARKPHTCDWCGERIEKKSKYWAWFGIVEGDASYTKTHPECEGPSKEYAAEMDGCWYPGQGQPRGGINWDL